MRFLKTQNWPFLNFCFSKWGKAKCSEEEHVPKEVTTERIDEKVNECEAEEVVKRFSVSKLL
jgi:hypothetical protein